MQRSDLLVSMSGKDEEIDHAKKGTRVIFGLKSKLQQIR